MKDESGPSLDSEGLLLFFIIKVFKCLAVPASFFPIYELCYSWVLRGIYPFPLALPLDQNENWDSPYSHVNVRQRIWIHN